ncbi:MAG TPA: class I SAM-dependent methyltransferase [Acidimicrobiales bacterium]|nr:class I SAM-dependent methyltransferase [Acidimicrobiales bacterium]
MQAAGASRRSWTFGLDACSERLQGLDNGRLDLRAWRGVLGAHQYRWTIDAMARCAPEGATVLDWGAGQGFFSYWLVANGFDVTSLDLSEPPLRDELERRADGRYHPVVATDPRTLPFDDATFDIVTSVGVLEHVTESGGDEESSLREVARVLRPDGRFICSQLPSRQSWVEWIVRRFFPARFSHAVRFDWPDVERLLSTAGLSLVDRARYGAFPRNSLNRLPAAVRNSHALAALSDDVDRMLCVLIGPLAQNLGFVAAPTADALIWRRAPPPGPPGAT